MILEKIWRAPHPLMRSHDNTSVMSCRHACTALVAFQGICYAGLPLCSLWCRGRPLHSWCATSRSRACTLVAEADSWWCCRWRLKQKALRLPRTRDMLRGDILRWMLIIPHASPRYRKLCSSHLQVPSEAVCTSRRPCNAVRSLCPIVWQGAQLCQNHKAVDVATVGWRGPVSKGGL